MASEKDRGKSPGECLHNGLYRCLPAANPEKCKDKSFAFRDQKKKVSYSHFGRFSNGLPVCLNLPGIVHLHRVDQSAYIVKLEAQNKLLLEQVTLLTYELRDMKRMLFGRKSERFLPLPPTAQLNLAELMAEAVPPPIITQEVKVIKKQATEVKPTGRHALPAHLPKVDIVQEPMEDTSGLEKIGEEITEQLDYTPGKLLVRRYIRPKYAKVVTDGTGYTEVIIAPLPDFPIEKGIPAPGLLAQILVDKHVDHLPIYRQIKRYQRDGVKLSASTISGWLDATADLLQPLGKELIKVVLGGDYVQADETPLPVLNGETKGAAHTGYLWAYHSPPDQLIFYDFQPGRGKEGPVHLLKDYSGYLQTDGHGVYEHASIGGRKEITLMHCMAHARRYFEKALDNDKPRAEHFLTELRLLYAIERRAKEAAMSAGQLLDLRRLEAQPVLHRLKAWLQENYSQVLPKSPIGKAIAYSLPRWDRLSLYATDGRLLIDNNPVENAIRPVALGRKNFLFAGSNEGGKRLALFYSLLASCKKQQVNPWEYLKDIPGRLPTTKTSQLRQMLPDRWKH
ncbi:MAG TPA: IS66 family transposase [Puia sp.]|uniref:IS66 family transposase n=1 Tax=Puia sp. TaxID=2045100 RepID=UPI002C95284D|nr:IS66 family transposase [Puia sp.]HVU98001.1 IS66 family transposase [Puia sp.]